MSLASSEAPIRALLCAIAERISLSSRSRLAESLSGVLSLFISVAFWRRLWGSSGADGATKREPSSSSAAAVAAAATAL